jgi:hypothetical protein
VTKECAGGRDIGVDYGHRFRRGLTRRAAVDAGAVSVISAAKHVHVAANHSRPTGSSLTDDSTLVSISTDSLVAGRQFS